MKAVAVRGTDLPHQLHPDVAVAHLTVGSHAWRFERDQVTHITAGRALCDGLLLEPDMLVHFKQGTAVTIEVDEPLHYVYMQCEGGPAAQTPVLRQVNGSLPEKDWGPIPTMLEGESRTSGVLLSREPDGRAESGIWICTPGVWACHVTRDELCHFLLGRCTYTSDEGEVLEIVPDTVAFFPQDWRGTCAVHETVRKVYCIR